MSEQQHARVVRYAIRRIASIPVTWKTLTLAWAHIPCRGSIYQVTSTVDPTDHTVLAVGLVIAGLYTTREEMSLPSSVPFAARPESASRLNKSERSSTTMSITDLPQTSECDPSVPDVTVQLEGVYNAWTPTAVEAMRMERVS